MSVTIHPISEQPGLRNVRIVELLQRQHDARVFLAAREHTEAESERIAYALDARLVLHPEAAPASVLTTQRQAALLKAMRAQGGRWKTGRAIRLYQSLGYGPVGKSRAAHDLRHLQEAGCVKRHDRKSVTYYTPRGEAQS